MPRIFNWNHDARLLTGSTGITFYALNYCVKSQNDTEGSLKAALAALKRRVKCSENPSDVSRCLITDNRRRAVDNIASIAFAQTKKMKTGALFATYYVLNGTTFI